MVQLCNCTVTRLAYYYLISMLSTQAFTRNSYDSSELPPPLGHYYHLDQFAIAVQVCTRSVHIAISVLCALSDAKHLPLIHSRAIHR
jgi:hypothetical protein